MEALEQTLFERLGGRDAVNAATELFYKKLLADNRVAHFFEAIDVDRQIAKQKAFLTYAFGGAPNYAGASMRRSHEKLDISEGDFTAVAENLQSTLEELGLDAGLVGEVMTIAASTHDDVLNL